jgi:Helix-turn-helix domain
MSAIDSMFEYLSGGNRVTARQARTMFKISNVADIVYRLRNEGVAVYTNRVTLSDGSRAYAYRIGSPSEAFVKNLESRHIARARKTLYRDAIAA